MDGFVVFLKPPGMTSSNAVYDVRRIFEIKKAGHLGTLDPGACGVLPISLGRATRLFDILAEHVKCYRFEILFGVSTDTQDSYGRIVQRNAGVSVEEEDILRILPHFIGKQEQRVPPYSALKIRGRKMYDIARSGASVPVKTHRVTVYSLELVRKTGLNRYLIDIRCSKGTYVRQLCEDIGNAIGTTSILSFLLRTSSSGFSLDQSYSIRELERMKTEGTLGEAVVSCEQALLHIPEVVLQEDRRIPTLNGLDTNIKIADGIYRIYSDGFLGIGTVSGNNLKLSIRLV